MESFIFLTHQNKFSVKAAIPNPIPNTQSESCDSLDFGEPEKGDWTGTCVSSKTEGNCSSHVEKLRLGRLSCNPHSQAVRHLDQSNPIVIFIALKSTDGLLTKKNQFCFLAQRKTTPGARAIQVESRMSEIVEIRVCQRPPQTTLRPRGQRY